MPSYYGSWANDTFTCNHCGWKGKGSECSQGELYEYFIGEDCPNCGEEIFAVQLPSVSEMRQNWDKLSDTGKSQVELIEMLQKEFAERSLKSPDQLPELEGDNLILVWDFEEHQKGRDTLIKYGERIIWSEPAIYEGYSRFKEVAGILKQRYKKRLQDLVPSRRSLLYLYGDRLSSPDEVEDVRKKLGECTEESA